MFSSHPRSFFGFLVMEEIKEVFRIDENYYPEIVAVALVVNAPKVFQILLSLLRPFIDEDTLKKTKILGADWMDEALKYVKPENLPSDWIEGAKGPKWEKQAGSYVVDGTKEKTATVQAAARDVTRVQLKVDEPNMQVHYALESKDYDIEFAIVRVDGEKETAVLRKDRYDAHIEPVKGICQLKQPGEYYLVVDNQYSWTTAKEVHVRFYLSQIPPKRKKQKKKKKKGKK